MYVRIVKSNVPFFASCGDIPSPLIWHWCHFNGVPSFFLSHKKFRCLGCKNVGGKRKKELNLNEQICLNATHGGANGDERKDVSVRMTIYYGKVQFRCQWRKSNKLLRMNHHAVLYWELWTRLPFNFALLIKNKLCSYNVSDIVSCFCDDLRHRFVSVCCMCHQAFLSTPMTMYYSNCTKNTI